MQHALHGTATVARNHRTAGGHGLKRDNAEMLPLGRIDHSVACCQQGRPLLITEGAQQPNLLAQGHTAVSGSGACLLRSRDESHITSLLAAVLAAVQQASIAGQAAPTMQPPASPVPPAPAAAPAA